MPSATFSAPHPLHPTNECAEQAPPPFSTKVARILSGRSPGYQIIACARLPFMRAKVTSASLPCARLPDYSGGTAGFAGRLKAAPCCLFPILPTWGHLTGFAIFSLPAHQNLESNAGQVCRNSISVCGQNGNEIRLVRSVFESLTPAKRE